MSNEQSTETEATEEVAEAVSPESSGQGKQPDSPESEQVNKDADYVTKEDYNALLSRMDGLSANLNRLSKSAKKDEPKKTDNKTSELQQQIEEFNRFKAESEARENNVKKAAKTMAVKTAMVKNGISQNQADIFAKYYVTEHDDKINAEFNGVEYDVNYVENEDTKIGINEQISMFLQTDTGRAMLPAKNNPKVDVPSGSSATGGQILVSQAEFTQGLKDNKWTAEELKDKVRIKG